MRTNLTRNTQYTLLGVYCVFFFLIGCKPAPVTPFIPPPGASQTPTESVSVSFSTPTPLVIEPSPAPTLEISPSPVPSLSPSPAPTIFLPSPTPACADHLIWIEDVTVPDDSIFYVGQPIIKQWRVQNAGTCNWDSRYRLRLVGGDALGAPVEMGLFPAKAGSQVILQIDFTAPFEPNTYRSAWQAYNPDGQPFGEAIYMQVIVLTP